jgi:hypothetical protein
MHGFSDSIFPRALASMIFGSAALAAPLRVAVYPFDQTNVTTVLRTETRNSTTNYGAIAAELVGLALQNHVQIVNRDRIQQLLEEQGRRYDERFDASKAAEFGKILGVDAILTGSIVAVDVQNSTSAGVGGVTDAIGGILGGRARSRVPKLDTKTNRVTARVQLTARLINASTGATIISQATGFAEEAKLANMKVNGQGASDLTSSKAGSDPYIMAALQEAAKSLSEEFAAKIAAGLPATTTRTNGVAPGPGSPTAVEPKKAHVPLPGEVGVVWKADGTTLTFFLSPGASIRSGETCEVQRPEIAIHPVTGKAVALGQKIGTVQVSTPSGEYGRGTYSGQPVKADDRIVAIGK